MGKDLGSSFSLHGVAWRGVGGWKGFSRRRLCQVKC